VSKHSEATNEELSSAENPALVARRLFVEAAGAGLTALANYSGSGWRGGAGVRCHQRIDAERRQWNAWSEQHE
jgi:hypothetical protein